MATLVSLSPLADSLAGGISPLNCIRNSLSFYNDVIPYELCRQVLISGR